MFKWILNWFENRKEYKYKTRIMVNFIESQAISHPTMNPDILQKLKEHFEKLEKFKFKKEYKMYCKIITRNAKVNFIDFYYGRKESYYPGLVHIFLRKGSRETIIVPESFLLTEKDLHLQAFNSKMDEIIK